MDYIPHAGEIGLIVAVVLIIFGLGRLPQLSYQLVGGELPDRDAPPEDETSESDQHLEVIVDAEEETEPTV